MMSSNSLTSRGGQGIDRELEGLAVGRWGLAELPRRDLRILVDNGIDNVRGGQSLRRHLFGIEPESHACSRAGPRKVMSPTPSSRAS